MAASRTPSPTAGSASRRERLEARQAGLRYVTDAEPGIRRLRCGRGFRYLDPEGRPVREAATLDRIRRLAIPPAYVDVWICISDRGHLQATGRDARGRKQYRYHPDWRSCRDCGKFDRLPAFADALPRLRRRLRPDLALPGFPREKVLALVVATLQATLLRVGNDAYARENRSYGLTTLRSRHARFTRAGPRLQFTGKGGKRHDVEIDDRRLARLLRAMHQLPGQRLFQYTGDDGDLHPIDSSMVNAYLRDCMGADFTAKDFRTWGATLTAFRLLAAAPPADGADAEPPATVRQRVLEDVAARLGNTVAVCRTSYVDPCVFAGWEDGRLARAARSARGPRQWEVAARGFLARAHRQAGTPVTRRERRRG